MAVGADEALTGTGESLHVQVVAAGAERLQEQTIVGILEVDRQRIVVDMDDGEGNAVP